MPRSTLAARNCAAVIIGLPPGTLTKHHSCMITNDVKVSISDIWYIYSKGFRPRRRRTEHRAETITARGDAFGAADIDARECCWQLWFDRQLPFEFALPASYMRCCSPKHFSGPHMIPKTILTAAICAALLAGASPSKADQYRPDEFLSLDLSKVVLSPKPLGPSSEFAPFPGISRSLFPGPQSRFPTSRSRISARRNRAARSEPSSRNVTAIRSMRKRAIPGFRSGRASRAASVIGSGRTIKQPVAGPTTPSRAGRFQSSACRKTVGPETESDLRGTALWARLRAA